MAVGDAHVFPGFLTPVLTQIFFPKPATTFLTCFCRSERRKYAGKKSCLNWGSNSQPPGHESDTLTTEPPGRGQCGETPNFYLFGSEINEIDWIDWHTLHMLHANRDTETELHKIAHLLVSVKFYFMSLLIHHNLERDLLHMFKHTLKINKMATSKPLFHGKKLHQTLFNKKQIFRLVQIESIC